MIIVCLCWTDLHVTAYFLVSFGCFLLKSYLFLDKTFTILFSFLYYFQLFHFYTLNLYLCLDLKYMSFWYKIVKRCVYLKRGERESPFLSSVSPKWPQQLGFGNTEAGHHAWSPTWVTGTQELEQSFIASPGILATKRLDRN